MATASRQPSTSLTGVAKHLVDEGYGFDFFQAVRLLEKILPDHQAVGHAAPPAQEVARFRSRLSLEFPPSTIYEVRQPNERMPIPTMVVTFMGMFGITGVLPRIYTERLMTQERDSRHPERFALREWLDLFNHRFISLFFRAWEKYRFYIPYERREYALRDPDAFTQTMFSLIGMGFPSLRNRLRISVPETKDFRRVEKVLGRLDDLALLRFGGFFAHRPRNAVSLQTMLAAFLKTPVEVLQFQGQWLQLDDKAMSRMGDSDQNNSMGINAMIGDRVWDIQSKITIRLGPLSFERFMDLLPDKTPVPEMKTIFLVAHLVRLYVGLELDVDLQLILKAGEIPACRMGGGPSPMAARIGWNTWSCSQPRTQDGDEPVFPVEERVWVGEGIQVMVPGRN